MPIRRPSLPRSRAFTLIELLVVVAIIALLISILLPSLRNARMNAQTVVCASNVKQILMALSMYQDDHRGSLPPNLWSENAWYVPKNRLWFYKLVPRYLSDWKVYVCPSDPFGTLFDFDAYRGRYQHMESRVPSCGYGLNYLLRHFREPYSFNVEVYRPTRPADTILMAEVGPDDELVRASTSGSGWAQPWRDAGRLVWDDGARAWYAGPTWLTARHLGSINMASMDGAARRMR